MIIVISAIVCVELWITATIISLEKIRASHQALRVSSELSKHLKNSLISPVSTTDCSLAVSVLTGSPGDPASPGLPGRPYAWSKGNESFQL